MDLDHGEEFALLAPACPLEDVGFLADRLRSAVPGGATVSIGVAAWDGQESAETWSPGPTPPCTRPRRAAATVTSSPELA
jgi:hypothetical protein